MMFTATVYVPQRLVTRWAPGVFELKLTRQYQVINRYQIFGQVINRVGIIADFGHK